MTKSAKSSFSAHSLLAGAREFASGLSTLARHPEGGSARAMAVLAAHAVELALKSSLLSHGWSESQLRELDHDLIKAWRAAAAAGLPVNTEPPSWCRLLDSVHDSPYFGRYPPANSGLVTPNAAEMEAQVTDLIALVGSRGHAA